MVDNKVAPGRARLLNSGIAEQLRQSVVVDQAKAISEVGLKRPTAGPADAARDRPTFLSDHYPPSKKRKDRNKRG